jgi:tellurite resistance protein TerA
VKELTPGGNAPVPSSLVTVRVQTGVAADIASFRLFQGGKVKGDADMVFYGQKVNDDGSIRLLTEGVNTTFAINLPNINASADKIAFSATCDAGKTVASLGSLLISVEVAGEPVVKCVVDLTGRSESALILGELYRRNNEWKFRFISQGFNGGLKPLAEHFGVDISEDQPPASPPAPTPKVSLSKVSLTKEKPTVSLKKQDDYGLIRVNLNWNQNSTHRGIVGNLFGAKKGIDLDLGAFVRLKDSQKAVVQALGNGFGSLHDAPFVELQGDDRTGAVSDGEWLHINGKQWKDIDEVLIYAFIYEGVPNWDSTDGVVTVHVPGQGPIESRLTDGYSGHGMCAIARLVNTNGAISVERVNRYFSGHRDMDRAWGWGFRWTAGSK